MTIAFVQHNKAFLPEIEAYRRFFAGYGITCISTTPEKLGQVKRDVDWLLMGTDFSKRPAGIYRIHEYASAPSNPGFSGYADGGRCCNSAGMAVSGWESRCRICSGLDNSRIRI